MAYHPSMIRSLLMWHWTMNQLCSYTLTPLYFLMIRPWPGGLFPSHWSTTRSCWCTLTELCRLGIRPWSDPCFGRVAPRTACVEDIFTTALMYYLFVWMALPPSPCSTINVPSVSLLIEAAVMILWSCRIIGCTGVDEAFPIDACHDAVVLTTQERWFNTKQRLLRNDTVSSIGSDY
jgi:hypothetical protein